MKTPLLLLLLLLPSMDDAIADYTLELDDDAVAAANNDYLVQRRDDPDKKLREKPISPAFLPDTSVTLPCPLPSSLPPRARRGSARTGPLFVFMSLQC